MTAEQVLVRLRALGSERDRQGMARYGINTARALGVSIYKLRPLAKEIGRDHRLALALWRTGVHEARMLAAFIDDPARVTETQMERWARGFDSWDLCDQVTTDLFDRTAPAWPKAVEWSRRPEEFVRRAGFAMMAGLAVHDKAANDAAFIGLFPAIEAAAGDDRNFVKKAVNWALRNIGKRNLRLNRARACGLQDHCRAGDTERPLDCGRCPAGTRKPESAGAAAPDSLTPVGTNSIHIIL